MLNLKTPSPSAWVEAVLNDFDAFLVDHAACERKASATALSMIAHYPDRLELVESLLDLALEELTHYKQVYALMRTRGLTLGSDSRDSYVRQLAGHCRQGRQPYFLDRLLIAGIVEARGCERFGLIAAALPAAGTERAFYERITASESRHHALFLRLARTYFAPREVEVRKNDLLDLEAKIVDSLPIRPALH